ncbi:pseudaminic acid biosynthesis-associated methylase [uncultured Tateyamaria sp.]|uniref:pseudaminic acid biosynthesis-associated methylase n=1 Tax=uncultured Tateyamaria sp. TaxID=455651 RepID=UPI002628F4F8|nr:pseudaminic acid biosynthesis-associated methylase [uncultured Tateyamaria sp.]
MTFKTEQEAFWAGEFGDDYIARNTSRRLLPTKTAMWAQILRAAHSIGSATELGCNIGVNLQALHDLNSDLQLAGVEINEAAAAKARSLGLAEITQGSILESVTLSPADLTFTAGVLIHIDPESLPMVYDNLVKLSRRYVVVCEYYNPFPVAIPYRGHQNRLFKRDFAGDLMDIHGLKLVDYGFIYKRDNWAPQDDVTWFLLEK